MSVGNWVSSCGAESGRESIVVGFKGREEMVTVKREVIIWCVFSTSLRPDISMNE